MKTILQKEAKILRAVAQPVAESEFNSAELKKLLAEMGEALAACDDGVALAAPQIGVSKRLFIVSKRLGRRARDQVFINPQIKKRSRRKVWLEEGCLSVRPLYGMMQRAEKVTLVAQDETGKKVERHASGLLAQIFQHETDHLDGTLFIDAARDLHVVTPPHAQD